MSKLDVSLTRRELMVMKWLAEGKTIDVTAQILGVSPKTVDTYRSSLYRKLNITSRAQLATMAIALRVIESVDEEVIESSSSSEELKIRYRAALATDRNGTIAHLQQKIIKVRDTCDAYESYAADLEALLLEAQAA